MSDLPKATHEGILKIGAVEIRVARLDNGIAIIHADDMPKIFEAVDATPQDYAQFVSDLAAFQAKDVNDA